MTLIGPELKVGDTAPDFSVVDGSLKEVTLAGTGGTTRIFSVVPSLDTPVCDAQTKRFNEESVKHPGVDIYTVFNMTEISCPILSEKNPTVSKTCGRVRAGFEARVRWRHPRQ